jgi:ATP-dependent Lon protease
MIPSHLKLRGGATLPQASIPLLPLRSGILLPGASRTFSVGRKKSVALVRAVHVNDIIAVVTQRQPSAREPKAGDLYPLGTLARVTEVLRLDDGHYRVGLEGLDRYRIESIVETEPFLRAEVTLLKDQVRDVRETTLLAEALEQQITEVKGKGGALGDVPERGSDLGLFVDRIAMGLELSSEQEQQLVATLSVEERIRLTTSILIELATTAEVRNRIADDVRAQFSKQQRDAILREQMKSIQRQLGQDDDSPDAALIERLDKLELPDDVRDTVDRELRRLKAAGQSAEGNVIRTYLDLIASLPWTERAADSIDVRALGDKLEDDHLGLDEVKRRILEHMAVAQLSGNPKGTILALVGPPGVGKTSLGQSVAEAIGRPLVRVALGGVRDEAEIRGHRRTYVGALPGRIINALRKAKVRNPVILLDEIDKLSAGYGGNPEAALLEVLDPEQNAKFTDHYLEHPFDLSEVMFIATANTLDTLSAPLRDRLEIVEVSGYTEAEKLGIARKHLIPKRAKESGVGEGAVTVEDAALRTVIGDYTREAGVRQLDRELTRIMRRAALTLAKRTPDDSDVTQVVTTSNLKDYLGKPRFHNEVAERTAIPGVATGLAWTPFGGDILFIETTRMPGKGVLQITGKLGDVMKESAKAALSYTRSRSAELGIDTSTLDTNDLHIHVPAGAVPKDGPSAGVTIFTALVSLLSNRPVRPDTAMTGECSLRGRVLPVGGIKAKVLAAHRAGIRRVILPEQNRRDIDDVPADVLSDLEVVFATDMSDVLDAALQPATQTIPFVPPAVAKTPELETLDT